MGFWSQFYFRIDYSSGKKRGQIRTSVIRVSVGSQGYWPMLCLLRFLWRPVQCSGEWKSWKSNYLPKWNSWIISLLSYWRQELIYLNALKKIIVLPSLFRERIWLVQFVPRPVIRESLWILTEVTWQFLLAWLLSARSWPSGRSIRPCQRETYCMQLSTGFRFHWERY